MIAYLITAIGREDLLKNTVDTNVKNCVNDGIILIADQSWTKEKEQLFSQYLNVKYYNIPYNSGLSYSRNFLVNRALELNCEYCLVMADNQWFETKPDFTKIINFLNKEPYRGIVGLDLFYIGETNKSWAYDLELVTGTAFKLVKPRREQVIEDSITYLPIDFCKNFFIAKTKCLIETAWDNRLRQKEHCDFMYRLKLDGWQLFYTESIRGFRIKNRPKEYRNNKMVLYKEGQKVLTQKWGIKTELILDNNVRYAFSKYPLLT